MNAAATSNGIANLLAEEHEYAAPTIVTQNCRQQNWAKETGTDAGDVSTMEG